MSPRRRFIWVVGALFLFVGIGVIGYATIEGWSLLDAFYMTVITLSTVGYKEVYELSAAGRIFSIILIIGGVSTMFYTLTIIVQYIIEGRFGNILGRRSRMKERISELQGHVILCGYGQVGREVATVFESEGVPFVVIELDQEAIDHATDKGYLYLQGNATSDETLKEAGVGSDRAGQPGI